MRPRPKAKPAKKRTRPSARAAVDNLPPGRVSTRRFTHEFEVLWGPTSDRNINQLNKALRAAIMDGKPVSVTVGGRVYPCVLKSVIPMIDPSTGVSIEARMVVIRRPTKVARG